MENSKEKIQLYKKNQYGEKVNIRGMEATLLASGDGTEVILHKLSKNQRWALYPEEGWGALEYFMIISGELVWNSDSGDIILKPGDSISSCPVKEHCVFVAKSDVVEFIYVSSRPVFHHYSQNLQNMINLAIAVEEKDGYTADHCERIMKMSMMVAEEMGLTGMNLYSINIGAFLHDVGKVRIPEEILQKPSKLTSEEWEIMKKHTIFGKEMVDSLDQNNLAIAALIVEQHHERYDGRGYPYGLKEDEIEIGAAIVSVVDSYDAMTTDRIYQKGRTKEEALEEIKRCSGTHYNPKVVDIFISISDKLY